MFSERLHERAAAVGSRVCLGIDPHPALLEAWGLGVDDSARAALRSRHTGAPGLPVRIVGLHAATKFGPTLTAHSVETVAAALDGKDAAADRDRSRAKPRGQIGLFDGFGEAFRAKAASVRSTMLRIGNEARK